MNLPPLPENSRIECQPDGEGVCLTWAWPDWPARLVGLALIVMMLITCSIMVYFLSSGNLKSEAAVGMVIVFALGMGIPVVATLIVCWRILFPKPETIMLTRHEIAYDSGRSILRIVSGYSLGLSTIVGGKAPRRVGFPGFLGLFFGQTRFLLNRFDHPKFFLEKRRTGRYWLRVDFNDRMEAIGEALEEADLNWLEQALSLWSADELDPQKIASGGEDLFAAG